MNKQVKQLVERVRLTDEEIADVINKPKLVEPTWDSQKGWIHGEEWQKHNAIAQAQLQKVLNHPDLALIDRTQFRNGLIMINEELCFGGEWEAAKRKVNELQRSIIPLAEALEEVEE